MKREKIQGYKVYTGGGREVYSWSKKRFSMLLHTGEADI